MKLSQMQNVKKEKISESYDDLKGCSESELYERLEEEIKKQKEDGVFNYQALMRSLDKIKDYLPRENYDNMIRIINKLK